jgi:hypothetical protein
MISNLLNREGEFRGQRIRILAEPCGGEAEILFFRLDCPNGGPFFGKRGVGTPLFVQSS